MMSKNKLHKFFAVVLVSILSALIAGIYGIIYEHIAYTISPEYYTKFSFLQYGLLNEEGDRVIHPRVFVTIIVFLSTWWLPFISGLILGLFNLIQNTWQKLFKTSFIAIMIAILITIISEVIGLIVGFLIFAKLPKSYFIWCFIPENLQNFDNYISVGSMEVFSFIGGILGLLVGIFYSYKKRNQ